MSEFFSHKTNALARCPRCGGRMDGSTGITTDQKPRPGDFTVCFLCAGVLCYDGDLFLRQLGPKDLEHIARHPGLRAMIDHLVATIPEFWESRSQALSPRAGKGSVSDPEAEVKWPKNAE